MYILAIESSCDETSAAVVEMYHPLAEAQAGVFTQTPTAKEPLLQGCSEQKPVCRILSNRIASQIPLHTVYGGVVPEIASRAHTEAISTLTYEALEEAGLRLSDIGAIGVTAYPGLIGALLVGVNFAKSLAFANHIPLIPVCHVYGHVAANYFTHPDLKPPFLALVASGGHTSILYAKRFWAFETIGRTRDDAIGEAFDKVARVMGIPYPGGAEMDRLAYEGNPAALKLPSAAIADDTLDFSFSGLKTAVINHLNTLSQKGLSYSRADIAASFSAAVVSSVEKKLDAALHRIPSFTTGTAAWTTADTEQSSNTVTEAENLRLVLAGGVAANSHLRTALEQYCHAHPHVSLYLPEKKLCGDNGAMIGAQAYFEYLHGVRGDTTLNARATMDT